MTEEQLTKCPGCGVDPGVRHEGGCDVARCRSTGEQYITCEGEEHEYKGRWYGEHEGMCGPDLWTGEWPGAAFCRKMGWYTDPNSIWGHMEDLNRLAEYHALGRVRWNPVQEDYEVSGPVPLN